MKAKPGLCWRPQDLKDENDLGFLPRESSTQGVESNQEREVFQAAKMQGKSHISSFTLDIEL